MFLRPLWLLFMLLPVMVMAQRGTSIYKNIVTIAPLRLIDPINPGLELNYERRKNPHLGTQLTTGMLRHIFLGENITGYRVGIAEKFYAKKSMLNRYAALGLVYNNVRFRKTGTYYDTTTGESRPVSTAIHRQTIAFEITTGKQVYYGRVVMDFSIGIGIKYVSVKQAEDKWLEFSKGIDPAAGSYTQGNRFTANVPLRFGIGYCF